MTISMHIEAADATDFVTQLQELLQAFEPTYGIAPLPGDIDRTQAKNPWWNNKNFETAPVASADEAAFPYKEIVTTIEDIETEAGVAPAADEKPKRTRRSKEQVAAEKAAAAQDTSPVATVAQDVSFLEEATKTDEELAAEDDPFTPPVAAAVAGEEGVHDWRVPFKDAKEGHEKILAAFNALASVSDMLTAKKALAAKLAEFNVKKVADLDGEQAAITLWRLQTDAKAKAAA